MGTVIGYMLNGSYMTWNNSSDLQSLGFESKTF